MWAVLVPSVTVRTPDCVVPENVASVEPTKPMSPRSRLVRPLLEKPLMFPV
jgi:hypothetical protein